MTLFSSKQAGQVSTPKTVLGFYALVLGLLEAGIVAAMGVLATRDSLHYLIPWILGFAALILVALLVVVVAMNLADPAKLQLGHVTARDYIEVQRFTQGDSAAGERLETIVVPSQFDPFATPPELPKGPGNPPELPEGPAGAAP